MQCYNHLQAARMSRNGVRVDGGMLTLTLNIVLVLITILAKDVETCTSEQQSEEREEEGVVAAVHTHRRKTEWNQ